MNQPNQYEDKELIELFQANFLDGDAIQRGQMVSSTVVKEFITDFVAPLITQKQLEARIAEANNYIYVSFSIKEDDKTSEKIVPIRFMEYRIKELQAELTKQEEKC